MMTGLDLAIAYGDASKVVHSAMVNSLQDEFAFKRLYNINRYIAKQAEECYAHAEEVWC